MSREAVIKHLRKIHNLTAPFRSHYSGPEPGPNTVDPSSIAHVRTITQAMALDAVRSAINKVNDEEACGPPRPPHPLLDRKPFYQSRIAAVRSRAPSYSLSW